MHITKLRLAGFKSFVEPTELLIEKGLTGVVGPNGCGKSNLLEALRWVMGETSHKSMRAAAMDDVIFSGTNKRPPRNMAEVTIAMAVFRPDVAFLFQHGFRSYGGVNESAGFQGLCCSAGCSE